MIFLLTLKTVVAGLMTLPAVSCIPPDPLLVGEAVPPGAGSAARLPVQLPAEHLVHINRGESPGVGSSVCEPQCEGYLLSNYVVVILVNLPHLPVLRLQV